MYRCFQRLTPTEDDRRPPCSTPRTSFDPLGPSTSSTQQWCPFSTSCKLPARLRRWLLRNVSVSLDKPVSFGIIVLSSHSVCSLQRTLSDNHCVRVHLTAARLSLISLFYYKLLCLHLDLTGRHLERPPDIAWTKRDGPKTSRRAAWRRLHSGSIAAEHTVSRKPAVSCQALGCEADHRLHCRTPCEWY